MIVALAGGVGGARLANGLARILPPDALTVAVNIGDDFTHLGLSICPDIDTVTYTMAGRNNREMGWGIAGETWAFMDELRALGGPEWFNLGDRDLAKHVWRTELLRRGATLSEVTSLLAASQSVKQRVVPMSDDPVRSFIETNEGELAFQDYFVRRRCEPVFRSIRFEGSLTARIAPDFAKALEDPALEAIVICPSNPILSIGPFLAVPPVADALRARRVPCVAVSPFIGGEAVKGPVAKILRELGEEPGAACLARRYDGIVDMIIHDLDDAPIASLNPQIAFRPMDTLMRDDTGQERLARKVLDAVRCLA